MHLLRLILTASLMVATALPVSAASSKIRKKAKPIKGTYLALLDAEVHRDPDGFLAALPKHLSGRIKVTATYSAGLVGFVFEAKEEDAEELAWLPNVIEVAEDEVVEPVACGGTTPTYSKCADGKVPWQVDRVDQTSLPLDNRFSWCESEYLGHGKYLYVLDSGIWASHGEFKWRDQVQTCHRNGKAHRVLPGADFVGDGQGTNDCNGHGTIVASAGAGVDGGIAKDAWIIPVRVWGCSGSTSLSRNIQGLNWIYNDRLSRGGVGVVNYSFGGVSDDTSLKTVITNLFYNTQTVTVAAAGNSGGDACGVAPQKYSEVITIAASTKTDTAWGSTNQGSCIAVFAGGAGVGLAANLQDTGTLDCSPGFSGTSFAAPLVAGELLRLLVAKAANFKQRIIDNSLKNVLSGVKTGTSNRLLHHPNTTCFTVECPTPCPM